MSDFEEDSASEDNNSDFQSSGDENGDLSDASISANDNEKKRKFNAFTEISSKKVKINKKDLYKPPTTEEINRLQENENLFNSNLFRLQIEELLNEIKIKQKYISIFERWFEKFQHFNVNIPEYDFEKTGENKKSKKKKTTLKEIKNNLCCWCESDYTTEIKIFPKPCSCNIFGKYKINSGVGTNLEADIKVVIPKVYFREKDYLNNRYSVKHSYYMSYIVTELKKNNLCSTVKYLIEHKDIVLPQLILTPLESSKITVKLHLVPEEGTFKDYRFEPLKNNIKLNVFEENYDLDDTLLKNSPTPYYNCSLARNILLETNYNYLESMLNDLKNVQDGIKLIMVWLKQRQLSVNYIGFTEELVLFVILYLIVQKRINKHMSSYQVIRNFWYFLSSTNWTQTPISLCEDLKEERSKQFLEHFDVVFIDKTGYYNLSAFLDVNLYLKVCKEAQVAVNLLDKMQFNSFEALFMKNMPHEVQFDAILVIKNNDQFEKLIEKFSKEEKYRYVGHYDIFIQKNITKLLKTGLNKRIKHLVPLCQENFIKEPGNQDTFLLDKFAFGITLDPEFAYKVVEVGPPADDTEKALEFQKFWGDLAHCRRFNDGSICEAVYFEAETFQERRKIFKRIVDFVLSKKLLLQDHYLYCDELEIFVSPYGKSTVEEPTIKIINVFDELAKLLRSLTLPLDITGVYGKSDVFCYSDLFPPLPVSCKPGKKVTTQFNDNLIFKDDLEVVEWIPKYCAPLECVIHLSLNSKWPSELEALKQIKTAFYLKISELLKNKFKVKSNVRPDFFDVFFKGLIFRFTLYHPKEVVLLKKQVDKTGFVMYRDTEESLAYERELDIRCKINGALNGIQSQHPSFGPSNTLIKRWLRSQLIDDFFVPDIVINLLNASIYLNNAYSEIANLPQLQFLRFLTFVRTSDWTLNSVVVNFNDEINKEQLDSYENDFHQNRENYPPLYIITPYDNGKSVFTIKTCKKEILRRISTLADASYKILLEFFQTTKVQLLKNIFTPNMDGYNLLIHLKPFLNSRRNEHFEHILKNKTNNRKEEDIENFSESLIPIIAFNPVDLYLKSLRENYGKFAYFFHDSYGGCVIAVLWKPTVYEEKDFKVANVSGHKLNPQNKLVFNFEAVVEDFHILGNGLVKNVEKR